MASAQILQKPVKDATNVVTNPLKDVQSTTKEITQPMKDVQKDIKTVTQAPKDVTREVDKTQKSIENVGKEAERTTDQAGKLVGKDDKNKSSQDSAKASTDGKNAADGKSAETAADGKQGQGKYIPPDYVPEKKLETPVVSAQPGVDPKDLPRPVPPGSRDNKTPSGPMPVMEAKVDQPKPEPDQGVAPTTVDPNAQKYVELTPNPNSGEKRVRPDYSSSPARIALEKADYDIETLEDLFKYSNWDGPEREHTVRAVEYSLNELQQAIVEVKKLDPGYSTWRFEERYKEMRTAFQKAKQI
ncbi:MAG: hypothetical protein U0176_19675 [Bacteroidia bacterium]